MLGLTAVAAVVAMAFLGASGASANMAALCKEKPELKTEGGVSSLHCKEGTKWTGTVLVLGSATDPKLLDNSGNTLVLCNSAAFDAKVNTAGGELKGTLESLTWTTCSGKFFPCEESATVSTTVPLGTAIEYSKDSETETGTVSLVNPKTLLTLHCFGAAVKCTYGEAETVSGTLANLTHNLTISAAVSSKSGGFCPQTGVEDATFTVTADDENGTKLTVWLALL